MNYLAHAYLSFNNNEILLGNMISDFVKGKQQYQYPDVIHKGIVLHRFIDDFTDTHPATKEAKQVFRQAYRLYSGAFIDVVYDHFLATDTNEFSSEKKLFDFSQTTYRQLDELKQWMPPVFERMFYYMQKQNWLYEYRTNMGTMQSFGGLVQRSKYLQDASMAGKIFEEHYYFLQSCYQDFWKDMKKNAEEKFSEAINNIK